MARTSIIVTVRGNWEQSRLFLKNIADTEASDSEVIVVDNASADITPRACPFLGRQLFGGSFKYLRLDGSAPFGHAANQGALAAEGQYLLFAGNELAFSPGWKDALLADFENLPGIAATGPVCLSGVEYSFGRTVASLGISLNAYGKFLHLYPGIPQASPLAQKRRFFQLAGAMGMMIPRQLFIDAGMFGEDFDNCLADAGLCARLLAKGLKMTVNPAVWIMGQAEQAEICAADSAPKFQSDWDKLLLADDMAPRLDHWQNPHPGLAEDAGDSLAKRAENLDRQGLWELLLERPYWRKGWENYLAEGNEKDGSLFLYRLFESPKAALSLCDDALKAKKMPLARKWLGALEPFSQSFHEYCANARWYGQWCADHGLDALAAQYGAWLSRAPNFRADILHPFLKKYWRLNFIVNMAALPENRHVYAAWSETCDLPARSAWKNKFLAGKPWQKPDAPAFSILMPVYNARPEFLEAAIRSVLDQDYPAWELCIADDASTSGETTQTLARMVAADERIRMVRRDKNGHIAAATNTALGMARHPWIALMDQDDLLTPDALAFMAEAVMANPQALLFYSDEDKLNEVDAFFNPYFKCGWDPDLFLAQNYICHLTVCSRRKALDAGGFSSDYPGSQDHEFLLRLTECCESNQIVHVPHVLYHWRAHRESTARGQNAKPEALPSRKKAVAEYLARNCPGATMEEFRNCFLRVRYPVQKADIAIICLARDKIKNVAELARLWRKSAKSKIEFIMVATTGEIMQPDPGAAWRLLEFPAHMTAAERLNRAAAATSAGIIGFISQELVPEDGQWPEEIAGSLLRENVGACAGRVLQANGKMLHGGYLADAYGSLQPVFYNDSPDASIWFCWNQLARTVDALDGFCLFTKRELFQRLGGIRENMGAWAFQDYCLRLKAVGMRSFWRPEAGFRLNINTKPPKESTGFSHAWPDGLEPFNDNLRIVNGVFSLVEHARLSLGMDEDSRDFSPRDYLLLYPEVAKSGVDPLEHYLRGGRAAGLKPRRSKISYEALTPRVLEKFHRAPKSDVVVCTTLTGNYEKLLPPAFLNEGWQYVCYTDMPRENWGIWELREIPYDHADPGRRSRWPKLNLPKLFPHARWVIWVDANIVIARDLSSLLADRPENVFLFSSPHPSRDCIFEEGKACAQAGKEKAGVLARQLEQYRGAGMPEHWGLYENSMFLLAPGHPLAESFFAQWWDEYEKYGKRDQISLPYLCFKNGFKPGGLFPGGQSFRRRPELHVLTHEETAMINPPDFLAGKGSGLGRV